MTVFSVCNLIMFVSTIFAISVTEVLALPYDLRSIIWKLVIGIAMMWFLMIGVYTTVSDLFSVITKVI